MGHRIDDVDINGTVPPIGLIKKKQAVYHLIPPLITKLPGPAEKELSYLSPGLTSGPYLKGRISIPFLL